MLMLAVCGGRIVPRCTKHEFPLRLQFHRDSNKKCYLTAVLTTRTILHYVLLAGNMGRVLLAITVCGFCMFFVPNMDTSFFRSAQDEGLLPPSRRQIASTQNLDLALAEHINLLFLL